MNRERLICALIGKFGEKTNDATELKVLIDQYLTSHNQPPMGQEDLDLLDELTFEMSWDLLSAGVNRKMKRLI